MKGRDSSIRSAPLLAALAAALLAGCALDVQVGQIWDARAAAFVSPEEVFQRALLISAT